VANSLKLYRKGAVGFIVWLGLVLKNGIRFDVDTVLLRERDDSVAECFGRQTKLRGSWTLLPESVVVRRQRSNARL
jgi:hypothetical protein